MKITFDPAKRAQVLEKRGLDLADAAAVFAGGIPTWWTTASIAAKSASSPPAFWAVEWWSWFGRRVAKRGK